MRTDAEILRTAKVIAVVGLSDKVERDSNEVAAYLQAQGYRIIPVNPLLAGKEVLGELCYADLHSVPERIDLVDIFRRSEFVGPVVDEAIAVGAGTVWMQEGIVDEAAAARARSAGLDAVMDKCTMVEHKRMHVGESEAK